MILGVNGVGFESGNASITEGRDLAWLQDTEEAAVWDLWQVEYRDVFVIDEDGRLIGILNVTTHDLADPSHQDTLKSLLSP